MIESYGGAFSKKVFLLCYYGQI